MGVLLEEGRSDHATTAEQDTLNPPPLGEMRGWLHRSPHAREVVCGGTAAAINIVVTFPLNKVMFRQQVWSPQRCLTLACMQSMPLRECAAVF